MKGYVGAVGRGRREAAHPTLATRTASSGRSPRTCIWAPRTTARDAPAPVTHAAPGVQRTAQHDAQASQVHAGDGTVQLSPLRPLSRRQTRRRGEGAALAVAPTLACSLLPR